MYVRFVCLVWDMIHVLEWVMQLCSQERRVPANQNLIVSIHDCYFTAPRNCTAFTSVYCFKWRISLASNRAVSMAVPSQSRRVLISERVNWLTPHLLIKINSPQVADLGVLQRGEGVVVHLLTCNCSMWASGFFTPCLFIHNAIVRQETCPPFYVGEFASFVWWISSIWMGYYANLRSRWAVLNERKH